MTHDCQSCPESNLALARPREWCRTDKNSSSLGWRTVREAATTRCLTLNPQALLVFLHQVVLNSNSSRTHLKVRVMMVCLEGHHCHNKARWNSRQMHEVVTPCRRFTLTSRANHTPNGVSVSLSSTHVGSVIERHEHVDGLRSVENGLTQTIRAVVLKHYRCPKMTGSSTGTCRGQYRVSHHDSLFHTAEVFKTRNDEHSFEACNDGLSFYI